MRLPAGGLGQVLARLSDPQLLICETCLSTGARISEVLGLTLKRVDLQKGTLHIQQRHCRGDIGPFPTRSLDRYPDRFPCQHPEPSPRSHLPFRSSS